MAANIKKDKKNGNILKTIPNLTEFTINLKSTILLDYQTESKLVAYPLKLKSGNNIVNLYHVVNGVDIVIFFTTRLDLPTENGDIYRTN